ncbi:MAG: sigma-70 family RNA polymerase sigma factor [Bacteroidota bacterium]
MPLQYSDEEMIQAITSGDLTKRNRALKQLYMDPVITAKINEFTKIYGNYKNDPNDILQEGIILIDRLIIEGKFQHKSKIRTYLLGICRNLLRTKVKKVDRLEMREDWTTLEPKELVDSPEEQFIIIEKSEEQLRRDQILKELLQSITPNCQEVLRLYYYKAKNMAQVASERGLKNAKQAKKAASRCREQIRKLIKKQPQLENFLKQSI